LTADLRKIEAAFDRLTASGNTALYNGVYLSLRQFERERRAGRELRRQALGLAYFPKRVWELERIFQTIARELVNQYAIAYVAPARAEGQPSAACRSASCRLRAVCRGPARATSRRRHPRRPAAATGDDVFPDTPSGTLWVLIVRRTHSQKRKLVGPVARSRVHPCTRTTQELRLHQELEQRTAGRLVQPPQALRLRGSQAETWHFQEFAADALKHALVELDIGLLVHVKPLTCHRGPTAE
jgi:hypothetical protein